MFLLPPAKLTKEDKFYADCNERGINLIDRVNVKPLWVYQYSIDRPDANWKAPKKADDEDDDWDEDEDE